MSRKSMYSQSLLMWSNAFHRWMLEDGSVSLQVPVSNETSSNASHEEDNHSETCFIWYASVQGADEPPLEEHAHSASGAPGWGAPGCSHKWSAEIRHPGSVLLFFSIYSVHPLTQLTHSRFFLVTVMQCRMHPSFDLILLPYWNIPETDEMH